VESTLRDVEKICDAAAGIKILCVGDIMLDRFVYGRVSRISPEAPIPILSESSIDRMLGAVGNVARNALSLGATTVVASLVGADDEAAEIIQLMSDLPGLIGRVDRAANRQSSVKTRYVSNGQQLLRVDRERVAPLSVTEENQIIALIDREIETCQTVLISDYAKGVVTNRVIEHCLARASSLDIPVILDPKGTDFQRYGAVDIIKPNVSELSAVLGQSLSTDEEVEAGLKRALEILPARTILLTRSEKGLSFIEEGGRVCHFPAEKREVFDVSGAGDTSLAALGLALATGASLESAARFALIASGIAVSKSGTAAVTSDEVRAAIRSKVRNTRSSKDELSADDLIAKWKADGQVIGFTNGCFDILHAGHLQTLEFAAAACDRLIVGLNSDASVKRLKGETRPINSQSDRARLLEGMKPVDLVMIFVEDTPLELIRKTEPDVLIKGGDYTPETVVGSDVVQARGGKVLIAPTLDGRSTTNIIQKSTKSAAE
tara:strand:+ start:43479 stop:44951 length:1473 start_codon:yes stop_codon:yes gene_type:complete